MVPPAGRRVRRSLREVGAAAEFLPLVDLGALLVELGLDGVQGVGSEQGAKRRAAGFGDGDDRAGELEAQVREYARAEAVAPPDVRPQIDLSDGARKRSLDQAQAARQAGNEELARSAAALTQIMGAARERLQVADAARREWAEATAAKAEAATRARAELDTRGPARWEEARPEVQAADTAEVEARQEAETTAEVLEPEAGQEIGRKDPAIDVEAGAWPKAQAEMAAEVDPDALTVMASVDADMAAVDSSEFDDNLARARTGAKQLAEKRARDQAERERAAVDEPVMQADVQARLEASATTDHPEADSDADLEI